MVGTALLEQHIKGNIMWQVRTQFSRPMSEGYSTDLEWSAVVVDTEEAAEGWWQCRTQGRSVQRRVHTMFDPEGRVVRVKFD
jgi:hypothetical protein